MEQLTPIPEDEEEDYSPHERLKYTSLSGTPASTSSEQMFALIELAEQEAEEALKRAQQLNSPISQKPEQSPDSAKQLERKGSGIDRRTFGEAESLSEIASPRKKDAVKKKKTPNKKPSHAAHRKKPLTPATPNPPDPAKKQMESKIEALTAELNTLRHQRQHGSPALRRAGQSTTPSAPRTVSTLEEARTVIADLERRVKSQTVLHTQVAHAMKESRTAKQQLQALIAVKTGLEDVNESLQSELNNCQEECLNWQKKAEEKDDAIQEALQTAADLQKELEQSRLRCSQMKNELSGLRPAIEQRNAAIRETALALAEATKEVTRWKGVAEEALSRPCAVEEEEEEEEEEVEASYQEEIVDGEEGEEKGIVEIDLPLEYADTALEGCFAVLSNADSLQRGMSPQGRLRPLDSGKIRRWLLQTLKLESAGLTRSQLDLIIAKALAASRRGGDAPQTSLIDFSGNRFSRAFSFDVFKSVMHEVAAIVCPAEGAPPILQLVVLSLQPYLEEQAGKKSSPDATVRRVRQRRPRSASPPVFPKETTRADMEDEELLTRLFQRELQPLQIIFNSYASASTSGSAVHGGRGVGGHWGASVTGLWVVPFEKALLFCRQFSIVPDLMRRSVAVECFHKVAYHDDARDEQDFTVSRGGPAPLDFPKFLLFLGELSTYELQPEGSSAIKTHQLHQLLRRMESSGAKKVLMQKRSTPPIRVFGLLPPTL